MMDIGEIHAITKEDLAPIFGTMTDRVAKKIKEINLEYTYITLEERDECIRRIIEALLGPELEVVGEHRHAKWEKGWGENLDAFKKGDKDALVPYYFRKDQIARWKREFIKPIKPSFDYGALTIILEWLYEKYMKDAAAIYEFGCGTGHHLPQLREINPTAKLVGLDWAEASQKIIAEMVQKGILKNTEGRKFNFFEPDHSFELEKDAVAYTVAALEQVGERHTAFVDYLLEKKPKLCVHVEPIYEVLDPTNLPDYLSIEYFRKRKYLWGFLTHLRELEKQGKVKIHDARRTYLGGNMFVDHYSIIVWSPL
jgi:hypothetical protein